MGERRASQKDRSWTDNGYGQRIGVYTWPLKSWKKNIMQIFLLEDVASLCTYLTFYFHFLYSKKQEISLIGNTLYVSQDHNKPLKV